MTVDLDEVPDDGHDAAWAQAVVSPDADMAAIAAAAGNGDVAGRRYHAGTGTLEVQGVAQEALDAAVASAAPPAPVQILSVLPVALRRALRALPDPAGTHSHALAAVLDALHQPGREDAADAFEYMVRADRIDLLTGGMPAALVDAALRLAATYPGADAVTGAAP